MEHLDYLVKATGGRKLIEHITPPAGWERRLQGEVHPVLQIGRARILLEIFHGRWPSEN